MTANNPMTGEQLDELMTVAVNMQRDSEKAGDRPSAMFAYAVQVAVLELRKIRNDAAALAAENAGLKAAVTQQIELRAEIKKAGRPPHADFWVQSICEAEEKVKRALEETPATDSFMAEVRAQGKIEGAESALQIVFAGGSVQACREYISLLRKGVQS
ncbi:hypothetical protein V5036_18430 [Enterobacter cloacae]|uniref:hypothetical protein n=1 Tax=Enterobacter cloacae TaxID=550 RepID=UPI0030761216